MSKEILSTPFQKEFKVPKVSFFAACVLSKFSGPFCHKQLIQTVKLFLIKERKFPQSLRDRQIISIEIFLQGKVLI